MDERWDHAAARVVATTIDPADDEARNTFITAFAVYTLSVLVGHAGSSDCETLNFVPALKVPSDFRQFNWADFLFHEIILESMKARCASRAGKPFKPSFGATLFAHNFGRESPTGLETPRIKFFDGDIISKLIMNDTSGLEGGIPCRKFGASKEHIKPPERVGNKRAIGDELPGQTNREINYSVRIYHLHFHPPTDIGSTPPPPMSFSPPSFDLLVDDTGKGDTGADPKHRARGQHFKVRTDILSEANSLSESFLHAQRAIQGVEINLNHSPVEDDFKKKTLNPGPFAASPWDLSGGPLRRNQCAAKDFYRWASESITSNVRYDCTNLAVLFFPHTLINSLS
ncbi:hypothetical protein C2845_PM10G12730 [Panicum miliaceum]|uniref:Uncharacterized protein n=1 Tax=Panicum miliaceum TaxID=4540 RepID=A0A3L6PDK4_PANMI|nr:hypothetical protein C2845_PM10G12730 [Panicum miliaceum]